MSKSTEFDSISFDLPKNQSNVIKVIGVGGGGSNAINHMFQAGINGVDFVICNTDAQALQNSAVPTKIQLGVSLTEGLGAGANPEVGEQAALESMEEIDREVLTLRHFEELTNNEVAEVLAVSARTVKREWTCARAWLYRALEGVHEAGSEEV